MLSLAGFDVTCDPDPRLTSLAPECRHHQCNSHDDGGPVSNTRSAHRRRRPARRRPRSPSRRRETTHGRCLNTRSDPVQSISLQRNQRLHDLLRARISQRGRRVKNHRSPQRPAVDADVSNRDGHYGLWLDDNLENGVSDPCPTFGNESLSEQGSKFDVMGVEIWYIGT
jgi:hypothetical protein